MKTAAPELEGRLFITVSELAALLQLDPRTVRRGIEDGSIPAVRVGQSIRIPVPKIRALIGLDDPAPLKAS
jgi:excisionase family DNA binding protein